MRKVSSHKKKNILECMHMFPPDRPTEILDVGKEGDGKYSDFFGQECLMGPKNT